MKRDTFRARPQTTRSGRPAGDETARPLTNAEYESLAAFRHALRVFLRSSEQHAAAVGITPQQYQALLALRGRSGPGPLTVGELAERLQVRHHSAVGLVDRLSARGLVERSKGGADRRRVFVRLTQGGAAVLERVAVANRQQLTRILPNLTELLTVLTETSRTGSPETNHH